MYNIKPTSIYYAKAILFSFFVVHVLYMSYMSFSNWAREYPDWNTAIAIVLDVSKSMNVEDIDKNSRLDTAKDFIYSLLDDYKGQDFSLSIFAWESQRVLPFTVDTSLFTTIVWGLDSNNITMQWSNVESWLGDALDSFGDDRSGSIIILTDGDEAEIAVSSELISKIQDRDISVVVIGFGTSDGWYIPSGDRFTPYIVRDGSRVVATLNEKWLQKLVNNIWWKYFQYDQDIVIKLWTWEVQNSHKIPRIFFMISILWILFLVVIYYEAYYKPKRR